MSFNTMALGLGLIVQTFYCMNRFENYYFQLLPKGGGIGGPDGKTVLMKVVTYNEKGVGAHPQGKQKEFILYLIHKKKINVNELSGYCPCLGGACNHAYKTALCFAAETGNDEGVRILIENGATENKSEKCTVVSEAVSGWLRRKRI